MKTYKLQINGENYEATVLEYSSSHAKININGHDYVIDIKDDTLNTVPKLEGFEKSVPLAPTLSSGIDIHSAEVRAPLPGVVVSIPLKEGDAVKKGQTILVIEAMKMESEIASPVDGKIGKVMVKERSPVQEGDILMYLEDLDLRQPPKAAAAKPSPRTSALAPSPVPQEKPKADALYAPIPGAIIEVKVSVGQMVSDTDVAIVLEAMKMESDIHFNGSGKVKAIHVQKGDTVQEGDLLIELEA